MKRRVLLYMALAALPTACLAAGLSAAAFWGASGLLLPAAVLAASIDLAVVHWLAKKLTGSLADAVNSLDPDGRDAGGFDELAPLIRSLDRRRAEREAWIRSLEGWAAMARTITESMREGLLLLDPEGNILSVNAGAIAAFGGDTLAGRNILHILRDLKLRASIARCLGGQGFEAAFERGGRAYAIYGSPVRGGQGAILLFLDRTESLKAEAQRKAFSANVTHELKTPLTTIRALSEMIASGMARSEDLAGFAGKIQAQCESLMSLIDDVIKLSEFDEGYPDRAFSPVDLRAAALAAAAGLAPKAEEKGVTLEVVGQPPPLTANPRMMGELLGNLIDNAVKYNRPGGRVTVSLSHEEGGHVIAVADTGAGIPPEHQSRVFERFYRVDPSRSQKTGGTGLGLAIVKHIVEFHRGRVDIASREGEGTTVTCRLSNQG